MRRLAPLVLTLAVFGCKAEPKAPPEAPKAARAAQPATARAKAPDAPKPAPSKPLVQALTAQERADLDAGKRADISAFARKWVRVEPADGDWVIREQCDAGVPTLTVDASPEQYSLHQFHGQDADRLPFDFVLTRGFGMQILDRVDDDYVEIMRLELVNDGQILRASAPGAESTYYVADSNKASVKVIAPKCAPTP